MDLTRITARIAESTGPTLPEGLEPLLHIYLNLRYKTEMAYRNSSDRLRGPWRDSVVEHWTEHSKFQREMSYDLSMKMMAVGLDPVVGPIGAYAPGNSIEELTLGLRALLQGLIEAGKVILALVQSDDGFRILIENQLVLDTHQLSDNLRMDAAREP